MVKQFIAGTSKLGVVIVAAGRGSRASAASNGPKQYTNLDGKAVLLRTVEAFLETKHLVDPNAIQVVIHSDDTDLYQAALGASVSNSIKSPVFGGATRQESVLAGLNSLRQDGLDGVLIHDAARPFVSQITLENLSKSLENNNSALPILPVNDTVKQHDGTQIGGTLDRSKLGLAQTPQAFHFDVIFDLHQRAATDPADFTDDASIAEHFGMPVAMIPGDQANVKLTTNEDIEEARRKLSDQNFLPDIRVGTAYDVHASEAGTDITLCGLTFPSPVSLIGHSDADVALHALTDAVLGALADGDIGSHFPPSEEKWRGAASDQFLIYALERATKRGAKISMLDVTIICEQPKIGPKRDEMRNKIAEITGISVDRIAVKATTNEKIGFVGREEGIAAIASATLIFPGHL